MAHGKETNVYRVPKPRHTANIWTLPCATSTGTRQRPGHVIVPGWRFFFCRGSIVAHGKPFAVCPIYSTRQRPALLTPGCRVRFAVCGTRQRVCRGLLGLCLVPLAHGKGGVSRSVGENVSLTSISTIRDACMWMNNCWEFWFLFYVNQCKHKQLQITFVSPQ